MEKTFVADTNLFFECKRLEDLPWSELEADPVIVVLTKPVQNEIDKHKNASGRTRRRAIDISKRLRAMLETGTLEQEIKASSPRVVLKLAPLKKPNPEHQDSLDYSLNDDRIVGILSTLQNDSPSKEISLLTDDYGPAATARSLGLGCTMIPAKWKRPPQESSEAKRIKELEQDLRTYRLQEPVIEMQGSDEGPPRHCTRRMPKRLEAEVISDLLDKLKAANPVQEEFPTPEDHVLTDGSEVTYTPASEEDIEAYRTEAYPRWVGDCESSLQRLHEGREQMEDAPRFRLVLKNTGTRPADNVRVTFHAEGSLRFLRRGPIRDRHDPETEDDSSDNRQPVTSLPSPPSPPTATKRISRLKDTSGGLDLATLGRTLENEGVGSALLEGERLRRMMATTGVASEAVRLLQEQNPGLRAMLGLNDRHGLALGVADEMRALLGPVGSTNPVWDEGLSKPAYDIPRPFVPPIPKLPNFDPEAFYFDDWPKGIPVSSGAMDCKLFRHQSEHVLPEIEVVFPDDGNASGIIVCTVHATNLSKPFSVTLPFRRAIEFFDLAEVAEKLVQDVNG